MQSTKKVKGKLNKISYFVKLVKWIKVKKNKNKQNILKNKKNSGLASDWTAEREKSVNS